MQKQRISYMMGKESLTQLEFIKLAFGLNHSEIIAVAIGEYFKANESEINKKVVEKLKSV